MNKISCCSVIFPLLHLPHTFSNDVSVGAPWLLTYHHWNRTHRDTNKKPSTWGDLCRGRTQMVIIPPSWCHPLTRSLSGSELERESLSHWYPLGVCGCMQMRLSVQLSLLCVSVWIRRDRQEDRDTALNRKKCTKLSVIWLVLTNRTKEKSFRRDGQVPQRYCSSTEI